MRLNHRRQKILIGRSNLPKQQHEKLKVLIPCLNACDNLLRAGVIIEFKRVDERDIDHKVGAPDIEIRFIKEATLWLLLVECKRPDGRGVHSIKQKEYRDKYEICHNVVYILVEDVSELRKMVEGLTGFYKRKLESIELF